LASSRGFRQQDLPRLVDRGLLDLDHAEPPRQRLVLLDDLLVLGDRGGADDLHLPAREARLEDVGRVGRDPHRGPRPDQGVGLVDEEDDVLALLDLGDHLLDPVLEHPPEDGPRHDGVHLEVDDLALPQTLRDPVRFVLQPHREPFRHGGLADPGIADDHHRVAAVLVAQVFDDLVDLPLAPDDRRDLPLAGQQVQVHPEGTQVGRQLVALPELLDLLLAAAQLRGETGQREGGVHPVALEDPRRDGMDFVENAEEQVLGVDLGAAVPLGRLPRDAEHLLGRGGDFETHPEVLARDVQVLVHRVEHRLDVQPDRRHQLPEQRFLLLRERDEQVLEPQVVMVAALRLLDRGVQHPVPGLGKLLPVERYLHHDAVALLSVRLSGRLPSSPAAAPPSFRREDGC
jgi:hypothetical protein